jgi:hypothetical protein
VAGGGPCRGRIEPKPRRKQQGDAGGGKSDPAAHATWPERQRESDQGEPNQADGQLDGARGRESRLREPADGPPERIVARRDQTGHEHDHGCDHRHADPNGPADPFRAQEIQQAVA